jgi:hypothetical protein
MHFNARMYSPYLNRWLQPDSIVPDPANPQALNRYSYVYNSPLNFTDPSGHDPLDETWLAAFREAHGREPTWEDITIRLFSLALPDEWDWNAFYNSDGTLNQERFTEILQNPGAGRSWANMPDALTRLANWYESNEAGLFVRDVGSLFAGLLNRFETSSTWEALQGGFVHEFAYLAATGMPDYMTGSDPSKNVHHWAGTFVTGYTYGGLLGIGANMRRELVDGTWGRGRFFVSDNERADIWMGNRGALMGSALRNMHNRQMDWRSSFYVLWRNIMLKGSGISFQP